VVIVTFTAIKLMPLWIIRYLQYWVNDLAYTRKKDFDFMIYRHTIFSTPGLTWLLSFPARFFLWLSGWRIRGEVPELDRYIMIAAPHTSNWDFALMLGAVFTLRLDLRWMGKNSLFPGPVGWLMKWLGGIPINRSEASNVVGDMVAVFNQSKSLILLSTPEGTRSQVSKWRTGFYHIATGASVPILPIYIHSPEKIIGFESLYTPSGDMERDMNDIKQIYEGKKGVRPEFS